MSLFLDFIFSSMLLLALVSVYEFATASISFPNDIVECLVCGAAIGGITIVILSVPVNISEGVFVDARWVLLSCCAVFLNWRIVVVGGIIAATYRYLQGGAGAVPGVFTIVDAVAFGILWRYVLVRFNLNFKWWMHYIFAVFLEITILVVIGSLMPGGKGPMVVKVIALPLLTLFPIVSTILSLFLQHHFSKEVVALK